MARNRFTPHNYPQTENKINGHLTPISGQGSALRQKCEKPMVKKTEAL
jgi:hypothetical protein